MCLIISAGPFGAASGSEEATHSLRMLTAELWDSVARVADGHGPDRQDQAVLKSASTVLRGQAEAIEFVEKNAAGAEPHGVALGLENLVEHVWRAATQLQQQDMLGDDPVTSLESLADALDAIAEGDRPRARVIDPLVERLSHLVEQSTSEHRERASV